MDMEHDINACPETGERECMRCSGEYCDRHFNDPCDCDVVDRHSPEETRVTPRDEKQEEEATRMEIQCDATDARTAPADVPSSTAQEMKERGPCLPVCGLAPTTYVDTLDGNERCDLCGHIAERNESDEMGALRRECDDLVEVLKCSIGVAQLALVAWDTDHDSRCGKLLAALAGHSPGYRADIDTIHAAIAKAEAK